MWFNYSFIYPEILTPKQKLIASDRSSNLFRIQNFFISNASGESKSACCVIKVALEIGEWSGGDTFIISGAITKHQMILGRDYYKAHKVKVDHGEDLCRVC